MKLTENNANDSIVLQESRTNDVGALSALADGLGYEVEDFVKLELTAEEMLRNEAMLVRDYVADDVKSFWRDLKCEILYWELTAGALMLRAADPVQAEWQRRRWW